MNGKFKKTAFGAAVVLAVLVLVLAAPLTYGTMAISSVVVDVLVVDASRKVLLVPYNSGTNGNTGNPLTAKVMSEADVHEIKNALCKTRVLFGFYNSGIVTIESPITARAVFWRRNTLLQIFLVKAGSNWKVAWVKEGSTHHVASVGLWGHILDTASQVLP